MEFEVDVIVVGVSAGGLNTGKRVASYGAKVAIIEVNKIGGTCVIRGCVPKKLMVYAANNRKNMVSSEGYGLLSKEITFESNILLKNVREEVSRLSVLHSTHKFRASRNMGAIFLKKKKAPAATYPQVQGFQIYGTIFQPP